ncbi:Glycosyltransferase like family 2 [Micromonospora pattaloongensis]|uniref:Glycosyltransferase like family 2 n=1 Tax=Micromonospora pattaloongensis TaxID=405436 RepID=A0A1H3SMY8_9ACTN|nr:glycosyltransferase family A protein [Micromonospora pattaloongensis]SDZ38921.1 Glycosyltransferase like family 2 [Micromonospora pattaloongensis]
MTRPLEPGDADAFRSPRLLDVLIPTRNRPAELATTLAGLAAQSGPAGFAVVVSDQSDDEPGWAAPAPAAMVRVLRHRGHPVLLTRHLPRRGLAEHRAALLANSTARHVLLLDDDVWLEPYAVARLLTALRELRCGFVGNAVHGLSYADDERPEQHDGYEEWAGRPVPEDVRPGTPQWQRARIHPAANLLHVTRKLGLAPGEWRAYKVSWIGGCVLFDRAKLVAAGGFDFWRRVPANHQGEDAAAQLAVMRRYGGAGVVPSGAYHLEAPTTVTDRGVECWQVLLGTEPAAEGATP